MILRSRAKYGLCANVPARVPGAAPGTGPAVLAAKLLGRVRAELSVVGEPGERAQPDLQRFHPDPAPGRRSRWARSRWARIGLTLARHQHVSRPRMTGPSCPPLTWANRITVVDSIVLHT
jgi:hypothetical protein